MPSLASSAILSLLPCLPAVLAHGHVETVVAGGVSYKGWDPSYAYQNPVPDTVGWPANNLDNGYVAPDAYTSSDIICHKNATPGQAYAEVAAGDVVQLIWNTWPDSHHGPVLDYLADCGDDCTTVDKTTLSFVKLDQAGLVSGSNPGTWATDELIAAGYSWNVTIPAKLAPGNYVLRHEIIALHSAGQTDGAQNYPQCVNLKVTGSGSVSISGGESATEFYTPTDDGILFNLYTTFSSYPFPGPAVWTAAAKKLRRHARELVGF